MQRYRDIWCLRQGEKSGWSKDVGERGSPRGYVLCCGGWMILGKTESHGKVKTERRHNQMQCFRAITWCQKEGKEKIEMRWQVDVWVRNLRNHSDWIQL